MRKSRIKISLYLVKVSHSNLYFCGGKTRFTHAIAANKRANSHNFKVKNLNLLTITFLAVNLMNKRKTWFH